jgi:hypothetical protein
MSAGASMPAKYGPTPDDIEVYCGRMFHSTTG